MKRQVKSEYLFMFKFYWEKDVMKKKLFYYLFCFDTLLSILDMVNKCCIYNCYSSYAGECHTVFSFPPDAGA